MSRSDQHGEGERERLGWAHTVARKKQGWHELTLCLYNDSTDLVQGRAYRGASRTARAGALGRRRIHVTMCVECEVKKSLCVDVSLRPTSTSVSSRIRRAQHFDEIKSGVHFDPERAFRAQLLARRPASLPTWGSAAQSSLRQHPLRQCSGPSRGGPRTSLHVVPERSPTGTTASQAPAR